jgi:hypothetical protein
MLNTLKKSTERSFHIARLSSASVFVSCKTWDEKLKEEEKKFICSWFKPQTTLYEDRSKREEEISASLKTARQDIILLRLEVAHKKPAFFSLFFF